MLNMVKQELYHHYRLFLSVLILASFFSIAVNVGQAANMISCVSILFPCILSIHWLGRLKRDFYDDSRYLLFLIPKQKSVFLGSRVILICIDSAILYSIGSFFVWGTIKICHIEQWDPSYGMVHLRLVQDYFFLNLFLIILSVMVNMLLVYLAVVISKSYNTKKFGEYVLLGIAIFVLFSIFLYIDSVWTGGNGWLGFFYNKETAYQDGGLSGDKMVSMYIGLKLIQITGLFYIISRYLKEKINL